MTIQKIWDHCHFTGKYWGASHNICKLRNKIPKAVLWCSNCNNYDSHFIMKMLAEEFEEEFKCFEENRENHIKKELENGT